IKGNGTVGIITYLRTDSTRVADEAATAAKDYITGQYGEAYAAVPSQAKKDGKKIQDAHEAIRPTDITRTPQQLKESLSRDQLRLYTLIWKRFTASRMTEAKFETMAVKIDGNGYRFSISTSKCVFEGFRTAYTDEEEEKDSSTVLLNGITKDTKLTLEAFEDKQHFTQPPAHYTEASLVKALEELGIGRPSTYSPTITTILGRRYIIKENKNLYVTELGEVVNKMMKDAFPSIVDMQFTSNMELLLDKVEEGAVKWKTIISNFYPDLDEAVLQAEKDLSKVDIPDEVSDEVCDVCGKNMVIKYGPHGKFLACPGFPDCRNTKPYLEKIGVKCPKCGKEIILRKTKKGRKFYGCESGSECEFMSWQKPVSETCPKCGGMLVEKGNKLLCINEACGNVVEKQEK
ncbi:MAG: type I DNA topoisomerase, partial [Clostridia bacterium]|nr:type I DNA topoisomerase [Clostridia bacterium]